MAGPLRQEEFDVSAEQYYAALIDYATYPDLLPEVSSIEVLAKDETSARVRYEVKVIKSFLYVLKMRQQRPNSLSWELESGDLFKKNSGHWQIDSLGPKRCRVSYGLDVEFKIFAPSAITSKLVAVNLPRMMHAFYEKAKQTR